MNHENYQVANNTENIRESLSNSTNDSEHASKVNSTLQNLFTGILSEGSHSNESQSTSPAFIPLFNTFDITNSTNNGYHHFLLIVFLFKIIL
ncbi:unnamed protein product [Rotaria sp. Silwood2]|nr:unnamed protein product [Rotaria sp. Silwood2]CAF2995745.1 unnamed protein product [Rotaria sp. Silwood2]CAF3272790.1 unnamed protein product [Rotaria sp. Silwood2]CAF3373360.1 unnamed protein product [Rotaria sp. Silwood2]CAF4094384.1 unnamed protein product [Rotaria sp. Silwood2]